MFVSFEVFCFICLTDSTDFHGYIVLYAFGLRHVFFCENMMLRYFIWGVMISCIDFVFIFSITITISVQCYAIANMHGGHLLKSDTGGGLFQQGIR